MTCAIISDIARKLGLTNHEAITLYAFVKIGLNKIGTIKAWAVLAKLVERFALDDRSEAPPYFEQLARKGVIDQAEALFFSTAEPANEAAWHARRDRIAAAARPRRKRNRKAVRRKPAHSVRREARDGGGSGDGECGGRRRAAQAQ